MNGRFELLTLGEAQCLVRFRDVSDTVLLASSTIPGIDLAERTVEWLRTALQKDWLYQIGRAYAGNGPMFMLSAPFGVVCSSPPFTSSDAMEHAIAAIKVAVSTAPMVNLAGGREIRMPAPSPAPSPEMPLPRVEPVTSLSRAALQKKQPSTHRAALAARPALRDR